MNPELLQSLCRLEELLLQRDIDEQVKYAVFYILGMLHQNNELIEQVLLPEYTLTGFQFFKQTNNYWPTMFEAHDKLFFFIRGTAKKPKVKEFKEEFVKIKVSSKRIPWPNEHNRLLTVVHNAKVDGYSTKFTPIEMQFYKEDNTINENSLRFFILKADNSNNNNNNNYGAIEVIHDGSSMESLSSSSDSSPMDESTSNVNNNNNARSSPFQTKIDSLGGNMVGLNTSPEYTLHVLGDFMLEGGGLYNRCDERSKKDIKELQKQDIYQKLVNLKIFSYKYNDQKDGRERYGPLAQQVVKVFPNLVKEEKDGLLSVNVNDFTPLLLTALQALDENFGKLREEANMTKDDVKKANEDIAELKKMALEATKAKEVPKWTIHCRECKNKLTHVGQNVAVIHKVEDDKYFLIVKDRSSLPSDLTFKRNEVRCKKDVIGELMVSGEVFSFQPLSIFFKDKDSEKEVKLQTITPKKLEKNGLGFLVSRIEEFKSPSSNNGTTRVNIKLFDKSEITQEGRMLTCSDPNETLEMFLRRINETFGSWASGFDIPHNSDHALLELNHPVVNLLKDNETLLLCKNTQGTKLYKLRKYQEELLNKSVAENSIVVCPTGAGKTLVAIEVFLRMRSKKPNLKALFIVDKLHLVWQQSNSFDKFTNAKVKTISSANPWMGTWAELVERSDIIVIIAAKLLDYLEDPKFSSLLSSIDLMIFDEAHHCTKRHPYNRIMDIYRKKKSTNNKVPHVLGLTASPVDAAETDVALDKLRLLERNMDAKIKIVDENKEELNETVSKVTVKDVPVQLSYEDLRYIQNIETRMMVSEVVLGEGEITLIRGTKEYGKQIKFFGIQGNAHHDQVKTVLKDWNEKLEFFYDSGIRSEDENDEDEEDVSYLQDNEAPKVKSLLDQLEQYREAGEEFRGILFVTTRKSVHKVYNILKSHFGDNCGLKFGELMGHGNRGDVRGMKIEVQQQRLNQFRSGEINFLVSTNVLEEGLDVPACNIVIYYGDITSGTSLIQARGRARHKDSRFVVIYFENSSGGRFYQESKRKEQAMHAAILRLQSNDSGFLNELQKVAAQYNNNNNNNNNSAKSPSLPSSPRSKDEEGDNLTDSFGGLSISEDLKYEVKAKGIHSLIVKKLELGHPIKTLLNEVHQRLAMDLPTYDGQTNGALIFRNAHHIRPSKTFSKKKDTEANAAMMALKFILKEYCDDNNNYFEN